MPVLREQIGWSCAFDAQIALPDAFTGNYTPGMITITGIHAWQTPRLSTCRQSTRIDTIFDPEIQQFHIFVVPLGDRSP